MMETHLKDFHHSGVNKGHDGEAKTEILLQLSVLVAHDSELPD